MLNVAVRKKLLIANPCSGVEFPVRIRGLFRPHYMNWSEQQSIERAAPPYLRNVIRIMVETGLRVYKELAPMKKQDVDLENCTLWIPDSGDPPKFQSLAELAGTMASDIDLNQSIRNLIYNILIHGLLIGVIVEEYRRQPKLRLRSIPRPFTR
jgi:integrase